MMLLALYGRQLPDKRNNCDGMEAFVPRHFCRFPVRQPVQAHEPGADRNSVVSGRSGSVYPQAAPAWADQVRGSLADAPRPARVSGWSRSGDQARLRPESRRQSNRLLRSIAVLEPPLGAKCRFPCAASGGNLAPLPDPQSRFAADSSFDLSEARTSRTQAIRVFVRTRAFLWA